MLLMCYNIVVVAVLAVKDRDGAMRWGGYGGHTV